MFEIIRKNMLKIIEARNYKITDNFFDPLKNEYIAENEEGNKIYIFFPITTLKVGINTIRQYIKQMQQEEITHSIIIVKDDITSFAKQSSKNLTIEYFKENELYLNKLEHFLVPKYSVLSESEKKEVLEYYKIKEYQLPKQSIDDPITKHFGAKKGQVFKIIRISETCGEYIYYRIVV